MKTEHELRQMFKNLSDKIVNMIDRDFNFDLTTVESSQLSENIFELLKEEGTQCVIKEGEYGSLFERWQ